MSFSDEFISHWSHKILSSFSNLLEVILPAQPSDEVQSDEGDSKECSTISDVLGYDEINIPAATAVQAKSLRTIIKKKVIQAPLLFALCSLLFALCSLLFALCSLLFALCSLLFTLYSLLFTLYSLLFTLYSNSNSRGMEKKEVTARNRNYLIIDSQDEQFYV